MNRSFFLALALAFSCTRAEPPPQERGSPRPDPADARDDTALACERDEDCVACSTPTDCGCIPGSAAAGCPEAVHDCFVHPCMKLEAACVEHRCALRPAPDAAALPELPSDVPSDDMKAFAEVIQGVGSILPLEGRRVEEIRALNPEQLTLRDTGFGAAVVRGFVPGRLGNAIFAVVGHEGVAVSATITVSLHASTPDSVHAWAERALGPGFLAAGFLAADDRKLVLTWNDPERTRRMHDARERELGPAPKVGVPPALAEAYAHLVSEFGGEIGSACGAAGSPTQTHRMFETIDASGDPDLLRSIMRGPSPEGRIYAAKALFRRAADGSVSLAKEDESAYAAISALSIPIRACSGCAADETELGADLLAAPTPGPSPEPTP